MKKHFISSLCCSSSRWYVSSTLFAQAIGHREGSLQRHRRQADRQRQCRMDDNLDNGQKYNAQNQQQGRVFLARHRPRQVQRLVSSG